MEEEKKLLEQDDVIGNVTSLDSDEEAAKQICAKCGARINESQHFCGKCGKKNSAKEKQFITKKIIIFTSFLLMVIIFIVVKLAYVGGIDFRQDFGEYADENWCVIADDGSYMEIDNNPLNIDYYMDVDAECAIIDVCEALGFSEATIRKMLLTSALDGRQTEENDKAQVSWKYHPNKGLEVLFESK